MRHRQFASFCASYVALLAIPLVSRAAVITGSVIGDGARPIVGATVQVVGAVSDEPCQAMTAPDGTFSFSCAATGRHSVRASFADLRPWQIDDVELVPGGEVHLNFVLLPAAASPSGEEIRTTETDGFWTRRLPNPVLATWEGSAITLRMLAIGVAAASFVLGGLTMFALGRRFGVETRRLSAGEVGDMILNPQMPTAGERVTPIAVVGARGASATVSYDADGIAAALADHRYGLVFVALVIAPGLFALFSSALAVAMLVGQETYLLCAMLLVPAGFVLTPIVIGVQALARRRNAA